ncbi:MAG TPA: T9SS type A sorting domain-containing protein [Ohtaekwangia sp.]
MNFHKYIFPLLLLLGGCSGPNDPEIDSQLRIYPNPALHEASIRVNNSNHEPYQILVFGIEGQILLEKNESLESATYTIILDGKPEGYYHVMLKIGNQTYTRELIKL